MKNKLSVSYLVIFLLTTALPATAAIQNPAKGVFADFGAGKNTFGNLGLVIINALLGVVGIVSILFIVIGGFRYITSAGNEEAAESGKKTLMNAVIGLVIVIFSYIIVTVIINATKGQV